MTVRQWLGPSREVQHRLSEQRPELAELGIRSLDIFGSVARGEATPGSDVDLLVEFDRSIGLFHFFRVQRRLEQILAAAWTWSCVMPSSRSSGTGSLARPSVPPREWRLRIEDILDAAGRAQRYVAGMDLATFVASRRRRRSRTLAAESSSA